MEERQGLEEEPEGQHRSHELPRDADVPAEGDEPVSKRRQKRLIKAQKNLEMRDIRRKQEKETRKANRLQKRLAGEDLGKEKRELNARPKKVSGAKVVIDLSFDELMTEKELVSMGQQIGALYHSNKWSCSPFSAIVFTGPSSKSLLETPLGLRMEVKGKGHWQKWNRMVVRPLGGIEGLYMELFDQEAFCRKEQLVYLTADSLNVMEQIEEDKVYIIGGLVDRNRHKRLCADKAERLGIQTARLPIDPSRLVGSMVLTVNGVVDILLAFNETQDWQTTFDRSLPRRKVKKVEVEPDDEEERYNEQAL